MRWEDERQSQNVEDRRDEGPGGAGPFGGGFPMGRGGMGGGGGMGFPIPMGRMGIGGIIVIGLLMLFFGVDPFGGSGGSYQPAPPQSRMAPGQEGAGRTGDRGEDRMRSFVASVLGSTEDVWRAQLQQQAGVAYEEPKLVLFSGQTSTACGLGQAAMGPFYCPGDRKVYIDLSFYDDLARRFRAPGDFAQAYVIAHEIGHHIQNVLGISSRTAQLRRQMSETEYNRVSVRVELQADCFAGVWAYHANKTRQILEPGDLEEALTAAAAIGDDRLQRQGRGMVVPDSFTHGTSEQRVRWFRRGFDSGRMDQCDTFKAQQI